MSCRKRVYISADFDSDSGDSEIVCLLRKWGEDDKHKINFVDTSEVRSGSVANDPDCRPCDLKAEFNRQINASSAAVIIVVGDKTASRTAGSGCKRSMQKQSDCSCTPYKQNANGKKTCKVSFTAVANSDVGCINSYSYLRHESEQAMKKNKTIIVVYNSLNKQANWLPGYLLDYESVAEPFWIRNEAGDRVGNYQFIMQELGYE